jgi:hypothetical protein
MFAILFRWFIVLTGRILDALEKQVSSNIPSSSSPATMVTACPEMGTQDGKVSLRCSTPGATIG